MKKLQIIILLLVVCSFKADKKEMTLRWGLSGEKGVMVVDETEILVIEWLEYVFYNNLIDFPSYIENTSFKIKDISNEERLFLLTNQISNELIPDTNVLCSSSYKFLFNNSVKRKLINFRDGLKGNVCIPIDSISLSKISNINNLLLLPITGITYEQAQGFINWRNDLEKLRYNHYQGTLSNFEKHIEFYHFSLPSIKEYSLYNLNSDSLCISKKSKYSKYNYRNSIQKDSMNYPYSKYGIEPVIPYFKLANNTFESFKKNSYGMVKHVQGNVAEFSNVKSEAFGGSYFHYANQSLKTEKIHYDKPEAWLGFRCIGTKFIKE